jgi:hypothetical protein
MKNLALNFFVLGNAMLSLYAHAKEEERVSCGADINFERDCTECFVSKPLKLGDARANFTYEWASGKEDVDIYLNENKHVVKVLWGYDGVIMHNLAQSDNKYFHFAYGKNEPGADGEASNGEVYMDSQYGRYFHFPSYASGVLMTGDDGLTIKFAKLTEDVEKYGKTKPLFQLQYKVNYFFTSDYAKGNTASRVNKACIITYPDL